MRATLEATAGPGKGRKILLRPKQVARVGRTQLADYAFDDGYLSGVHFSVSFDGSECRVRDLGSSNGTFVNGQQVMEATLNSGDEIQAGGCRFSVQIDLTAAYRPPAGRTTAAVRSETSAGEGATRSIEAAAGRQAGGVSPLVSRSVQGRTQPLPAKPQAEVPAWYERGLGDEDADVRRAALFAAVWTRKVWVLRHLGRLAADASPDDLDSLRIFAILAEPIQVKTILSIVRNSDLGPERFGVAGRFGHPAIVMDLLAAMSWEDAAVAEAASEAFQRITGADLTAIEADEAAPEDNSTASAAAVEAARAHWRKEESRFAEGTRWSRGRNVSQPIKPDEIQQLDLETRWEVLLREHFYRHRDVSLRELQLPGPVV